MIAVLYIVKYFTFIGVCDITSIDVFEQDL